MKSVTGPYAVQAVYTEQKYQRMRGNILIEALPPQVSAEQMLDSLVILPDFSPEQRLWDPHERIQQIKTLQNCLIPLDSHVELASSLDVAMREGYVSRPPRSAAQQARLQQAYELQKAGKTFAQAASVVSAQDSMALIGVPGMGKTTTVKRCLERYPRVIQHPNGVTQIPYIHVEMSSNGKSVKSLAIAIITQIDQLVPECEWARLYLSGTSRTSTEALIHAAARLVAIHNVGLIVADEVQNLSASKQGDQAVMTELVTLCNTFKVPLVFIGTYKAEAVLGADFRSARRACGGLAPWDPLPRYDSGLLVARPGEDASQWGEFLEAIWGFQWVKDHVPITKELTDYFHNRTQGIIDLTLKLFAIGQIRAITTGAERLSKDLFDEVYELHFGLLHEPLEALRKKTKGALAKFADLHSLDVRTVAQRYEAGKDFESAQTRASRPGDGTFAAVVEEILVAGGVPSDAAAVLAEAADASDRNESPLQAAGRIAKEHQPTKARKSGAMRKPSNVIYPDFLSRPQDYRGALARAQETGETVLTEMMRRGMLWTPQPPFVRV